MSELEKRSMRIAGHRTSIALEPEFWDGVGKIAEKRDVSIPVLMKQIDEVRAEKHPERSLASAVRVHVLQHAHP